MRPFWTHAIYREDSILIFGKAQNVAVSNGTISLHSLTTNETASISLPHPCVQVSSEGVSLTLARCWKWLPIEHSYKMTVSMGALWLAGRPVVFPDPLYFRIIGCRRSPSLLHVARVQLKISSVLPKNGELVPRKSNLVIKFSQPVQWGEGKIHFVRYFPSNPQMVVEQFDLESRVGMLERSLHHALVLRAGDLPLQPNSWYRVEVDETVVRNEVWNQLRRTETMNFTVHTLDDDCSYVHVYDSLDAKTELLCKYVEQRCICQRIFL